MPAIFILFLGSSSEPSGGLSNPVLNMLVKWTATIVLIIGVVLLWERLPLSSIGLRRMSLADTLWAVGAFVAGILTFALTSPLVSALGLDASGGIGQFAQLPVGLSAALLLTAGITEEILFRGYPIERLQALTGSVLLSATTSYIVFVVLHIPLWGTSGAIQIGAWSLVVTALYVWRRNLPACMLMHLLTYAFAALPLLSS